MLYFKVDVVTIKFIAYFIVSFLQYITGVSSLLACMQSVPITFHEARIARTTIAHINAVIHTVIISKKKSTGFLWN